MSEPMDLGPLTPEEKDAALTRLLGEKYRLVARVSDLEQALAAERTARLAAEAARDRALAALARYGEHDHDCAARDTLAEAPCSCGLAGVLEANAP